MIGLRQKLQLQVLPKLHRFLSPGHDIALLGWHGQGAFGDDLLGRCVQRVLSDEAARRDWTIRFTSEAWCDLIVVGGGSLLGFDSMGLYELIKRLKTPLVLFGGGFRRQHRALDETQRSQMEAIFKRARLKGVRGYISQQFFIHNDLEEVEVIGDPGWLFEPVSTPPLAPGFRLGLVVRSMGKTSETQYLDNRQMGQIIAQVADTLIERFQAKPYFFCLAESIHDSDTEGARNTIALMKYGDQAEIIPMDPNPFVTGSLIGQMDYLVSQRLHPAVVAWASGKPCVAFEYQFGKTVDCLNSIGMDEFVIRTDEFSMDAYMTKFNRLWGERELVIRQSQRAIIHWRQKLQDFARRTLDILDAVSRN